MRDQTDNSGGKITLPQTTLIIKGHEKNGTPILVKKVPKEKTIAQPLQVDTATHTASRENEVTSPLSNMVIMKMTSSPTVSDQSDNGNPDENTINVLRTKGKDSSSAGIARSFSDKKPPAQSVVTPNKTLNRSQSMPMIMGSLFDLFRKSPSPDK